MNTLRNATILLLGLFLALNCFAENKEDKIDNLLTVLSENGMFNGCVLVAEKGKLIYKNAFGYSDKEKQKQLTTHSAFYLASVSKQLTAMSVMILENDEKLSFSDRLTDFFPDFPSYAEKITIEHLLTHTSGIPDHFRLGSYKPDLANSEVLEILLEQKAPDFEAGEEYRYSNGGYVLLALIAEKASGKPFHSLLRSRIFEPLGMQRTLVYDESKPDIKNRAIGYRSDGTLNDYELLTTGAGGIYSTIEDLFKWDQALYSEVLIPNEKLQKAFIPKQLNNGKESNYGYGWAITKYENETLALHGGSLSGFRTYIERNLDSENTIIILSNNSSAIAARDLPRAIRRILQKSGSQGL